MELRIVIDGKENIIDSRSSEQYEQLLHDYDMDYEDSYWLASLILSLSHNEGLKPEYHWSDEIINQFTAHKVDYFRDRQSHTVQQA